jgi:hypothetical protein
VQPLDLVEHGSGSFLYFAALPLLTLI